jgi:acetylglutamate/LysW-gamma-L-alpha-aminoadipate kinase
MGVHADAVMFLTDVKGFMMDGRVVERLTPEEARALLPKTGFGMQKKILAGVGARQAGKRDWNRGIRYHHGKLRLAQ